VKTPWEVGGIASSRRKKECRVESKKHTGGTKKKNATECRAETRG